MLRSPESDSAINHVHSESVSGSSLQLNHSNSTAYGKYIITGMSCAACATRIEKVVSRIPGISNVRVNLSAERAHIRYNHSQISEEKIIQTIQRAGYQAYPDTPEQVKLQEKVAEQAYQTLWNRWFIAMVLTSCLMIDMYFTMNLHRIFLPVWCQWIMSCAVQWLIGWRFYRGAIRALRSKTANMDVLVAFASGIAFLESSILAFIGYGMVSFDGAAMVIVMVTLGKLLEMRAKHRVNNLLSEKTSAQNTVIAHLYENQNLLHDIPAELLVPGQSIQVYNQEQVPTDVVLVKGRAFIDESFLTGEAHPIDKQPGEFIYGGSYNLSDSWIGRVVRTSDDTVHAHMRHLMDEAQMDRTNSRQWIDQIILWFVPIVFLISLVSFVFHIWTGHLIQAITNAIAVLVAACPCALGLATPTALSVGMHLGLRRGICLRNEDRLRQLSKVNTLIFDKTGTLTTGRLEIVHLQTRADISLETLLRLAASVENGVDHPVARAILQFADTHQITPILSDHPAISYPHGVSKKIETHSVFIGRMTHLESTKETKQFLDQSGFGELRGIDVFRDNEWIGTMWFADEIRPEAKEVIQTLQKRKIEVILLTGDDWPHAKYTANYLGIQNYRAKLSAVDKINLISQLQHAGRIVAMVGDGINDAPALSTAHIGIAFGAATPAALQASDIAILRGDLREILWSTKLATKMLTKIKQNLSWAVLYNVFIVPLAFVGQISPMWAGIGMAFSSVIVMTNSLLLQKSVQESFYL